MWVYFTRSTNNSEQGGVEFVDLYAGAQFTL